MPYNTNSSEQALLRELDVSSLYGKKSHDCSMIAVSTVMMTALLPVMQHTGVEIRMEVFVLIACIVGLTNVFVIFLVIQFGRKQRSHLDNAIAIKRRIEVNRRIS